MRSTDQFDFYSGGGVDMAFLGAGEVDAEGNVNVSRLGQDVVGPGGFVDISQGAKAVVFCGTFETGGLDVQVGNGSLTIASRRAHPEIRRAGPRGDLLRSRRPQASAKSITYVTERAVFKLTPDGVTLVEIAPGIDLQRHVLDRMAFQPVISPDLKFMDPDCFVGDGAAPEPRLQKTGAYHA